MSNIAPIEVLIAEDEETDAFFIKSAFDQLNFKCNVHMVKDGEEVMDFLNKRESYKGAPRPNIIFLDIKMPKKDGHETLVEIKKSELFRDIPVIMLSSSRAENDVFKSYENLANAHVPKSNGFPEMLKLVKSIEEFWFEYTMLPKQNN